MLVAYNAVTLHANNKGKPMPVDELTKDEQKDVLKQAIQEWLDAQFAAFGRWTFYGLCVTGFSLLVYMWLHTPLAGALASGVAHK